jgi:NADH-quinone oxidoreductase subunit H
MADTLAHKPDRVAQRIEALLRNGPFLAAILVALLIAPVVLGCLFWPWLRWLLSNQFPFTILMMALTLFVIIHLCAACILAERKLSAFIQDRKGPNRVGYWGILQPVADGIKFLLKEDITPARVDRPVFLLAPCIAFTISLLGFAVIPWAGEIQWPWMPPGQRVTTQVASLDVGLLYMLAVASLGVYGVVLAGWASNNKYAFYGGMRATAQMLSYEVPLGLALLVVLLMAGNLRLELIVDQQAQSGVWNVLLHPIAFLLLLISAIAETNRAPFDLAECEQELVGGFHTEYSSMKFALFFLAEYAHMITNSALMVALFFGGWAPLPFSSWLADDHSWGAALIKFSVYWGKVCAFIGFYMLIRWTLPRFRFDQLMRLAWKSMVPVGMAVVSAAGLLAYWGLQRNVVASLAANLVVVAIAMFIVARTRRPVTGRQENLPEVEVASSEL